MTTAPRDTAGLSRVIMVAIEGALRYAAHRQAMVEALDEARLTDPEDDANDHNCIVFVAFEKCDASGARVGDADWLAVEMNGDGSCVSSWTGGRHGYTSPMAAILPLVGPLWDGCDDEYDVKDTPAFMTDIAPLLADDSLPARGIRVEAVFVGSMNTWGAPLSDSGHFVFWSRRSTSAVCERPVTRPRRRRCIRLAALRTPS
jgi:hypothetical protein